MEESDRLTKLEEIYSHLQHHVSEQDRVILALSDDLKRLSREVVLLRQRQVDGEEIVSEPPPHY